jgi:hypothetical protein
MPDALRKIAKVVAEKVRGRWEADKLVGHGEGYYRNVLVA